MKWSARYLACLSSLLNLDADAIRPPKQRKQVRMRNGLPWGGDPETRTAEVAAMHGCQTTPWPADRPLIPLIIVEPLRQDTVSGGAPLDQMVFNDIHHDYRPAHHKGPVAKLLL